MPTFTHRSYQSELLDKNDIPFVDIKQNMKELNAINHWLGGHAITLKGVKRFCKTRQDDPFRIIEIGCGGGDNLRAIQQWANRNQINVELSGIDINEECIEFARSQESNKGISFIRSDYRDMEFKQPPHVIFSSLFCHHFTDKELHNQLKWMYHNALDGFFINDLHRHPLAYYSIKGLTKLFSKSYLVKNDAPLSVLRGFKRKEWEYIIEAANIGKIDYQWCWAFRWLLICTRS
jgi:2-polyprenyl-3-methyl-5-hydroxy-6-metoxy-1,4-benzoquinol methylase